jgi:hypothetical protein
MVEEADEFIFSMKQWIDILLTLDPNIQEILIWINQETSAIQVKYTPAIVRAFALNLVLDITYNLDLNRDLDLIRTFNLRPIDGYHLAYDLAQVFNLTSSLPSNPSSSERLNPELQNFLRELRCASNNEEELRKIWLTKGYIWSNILRNVITPYYRLDYDWNLDNQQLSLLLQYYESNKLLIDCLNNVCNIHNDTRKYILKNLLLPMRERE